MKSHELGGMYGQTASPVASATLWAGAENLGPGAQNAEVARLRRLGFVAGIRESLAGRTQNRYGVSIVEQFKSNSGAVAELHHTYSTYGPWTLFTVPGVPGARGFEQDGSTGGRNIGFTHGDYYYLIGSGWQSGAANAVPRAAMIAAAQALYHKVSG